MISGIGIDAVDIPRFKKALERWGGRLLKRVFTDRELEYCLSQKYPERHLSARFAAKVGLCKALGRAMSFRSVEIIRGSTGRPELKAEGIDAGLKLNLSITHDGDLSIAEVIVEKV